MPRVTLTEPDHNPQPYQFDLDVTAVRIGRSDENEIVLNCPSISSEHAEMVRVPGGFAIQDLASSNGISKEGERVEICHLADGDQVMLGDVAFDFSLSEDELAMLAAEVTQAAAPEHGAVEAPVDARPTASPPPPRAPYRPAVKPLASARRSLVPGWALALAFLVFGGVAFYSGLSLRHKNETGKTLGETTRTRLTTPDVTRLAARDPDLYHELFFKPEEVEKEEEFDIVVAPLDTIAEVPAEIEGWEDRERRDDLGADPGEFGGFGADAPRRDPDDDEDEEPAERRLAIENEDDEENGGLRERIDEDNESQ